LVLHCISKVKSEIGEPGERRTGNQELDKIFPELYEAYEKKLLQSNAFDFDDLIEKPVRAFLKHQSVLQKYREQFQYILVDEFQDINTAQYEFIRLLGEKSRNISVVGDDQQSIYSFRGSDFRNFLNFEKDWPGTKVVLLEENYRSTGNIISSASAVIANNKIQKVKNLWTKNAVGEPVTVVEHADERAEASWIADVIFKIAKATKESGEISREPAVAVLYRTNAQSRELEQALIERHIAYEIFGGVRFYDRKEIKDIVSCLRYAVNPKDAVSLERISENFLKKPSGELIHNLPGKPDILNPVELTHYILKTADYLNYLKRNFPNAEERIENITELITFASSYKNTRDFLEKITLLQGNEMPSGRSKRGVKSSVKRADSMAHLMTIHSAKGLEFNTVIVAGCVEGLLPHGKAYKNNGKVDGIEEERRLMYVAMTRAQQQLFLSFYGLGSRFLYEIPPELIQFTSFVSDYHDMEFSSDEERYIIFP
ncbi:MAG: 3'-5' exonuclease, partial [bacterium]|nr:3'-5' exonuclease [bacterium]